MFWYFGSLQKVDKYVQISAKRNKYLAIYLIQGKTTRK